MRYKISHALIKGPETRINVAEEFAGREESFKFRDRCYEEKLKFECEECLQELSISKSSRNNLYFKHNPGSRACIFKDPTLSPGDVEIFRKASISRESDRHKFLKNSIGQKLKMNKQIDPISLKIDDQYLVFDGERRKPDVYCEYQGKKIVFEIQLSDLSPRYIIERNAFYKNHGIFLIWILDSFKFLDQPKNALNLKYLSEHHNFFHLNESEPELRLNCKFKKNYIFDDKEVRCKWYERTLALESLVFDQESTEVYFYHYGNARKKKKAYLGQLSVNRQITIDIERKIAERKAAIQRVEQLIREVKAYHDNDFKDYKQFQTQIRNFGPLELELLNDRMGLIKKLSRLFNEVKKSQAKDFEFLYFLLDTLQIRMNVNSFDEDGRSLFEIIVSKTEFPFEVVKQLIRLLLERGYILKPIDHKVWNQRKFEKKDEAWFSIFEKFSGGEHLSIIQKAFNYENGLILLMIESIRKIDFLHLNYGSPSNMGSWVQFVNNSLQYHGEYYEYIQLAFIHFHPELWEDIKQHDLKRNKSLKSKLDHYAEEPPELAITFLEIFYELYEEVYESSPNLRDKHFYYLFEYSEH
tara:strand:- start:1022 stop:2767 length:1746 start_codon:yes stop_codon:yes gene_type:complete